MLQIGFNAVNKPLNLTDDRKNHQHVIGSSGSGKSKFLEAMIRGDLHARQGFCLIDPHGQLYNDVLKYAGYRVFEQDIILLNLSEPKQIVPFNFFSKNSNGDVSVQVDNRIQATLHAWGVENADQTPTLERMLRLIYTSLLEADLTLPQVAVLLDYSKKEARDKIISKIQNPLIRAEWQEVSNLTKAKDFRDETLSAKNRLFRLLTSKVLMQFLGIKGKTIDLLEAMNQGKTILVNLAQSENLSRENAKVFGSLLVNQFFESAIRRNPKDNPKPYYLYLDEFQNFVSIDLCNMLDEVRKFGLFLILSHQRFGQLNEDIEDAVLTNCRIKTVFGGLRTEDARRMAEELFIGKIDPKKIKASIYLLKHWYKYTREKVYSSSTSYSTSTGESIGEGSGTASSSQNASVSGQMSLPPSDEFFTGAMWLGDSNITGLSESESSGFSSGDSHNSFSSQSYSESYTESESVADIPVFVPMPFQELSSIQYYTPEEQLLELTQALKLQQQRHCFIQLPNKETQPLLVPFVKEYNLSNENFNWYLEQIAKQNNAITPAEADKLLSDNQIQTAPPKLLQGQTAQNQTNQLVKKKNIFDQLNKGLPKVP